MLENENCLGENINPERIGGGQRKATSPKAVTYLKEEAPEGRESASLAEIAGNRLRREGTAGTNGEQRQGCAQTM